MDSGQVQAMPVVERRADFDSRSGNLLERAIFNHRGWIVGACLVLTVFLGFCASKLQINASFDDMLAQSQPFIRNYLDNKDALRGLGNSVRIVVENKKGDIYDPEYLKVLQQISDGVFLIHGVDRLFMKSLWTPALRWTQITEDGYRGGAVMPDDYDGSPSSLEKLKYNVGIAGIIGSYVGSDQKSSMIVAPLLDRDPQTGAPLDYKKLSEALETVARARQSDKIAVHISGFAELEGDLIAGVAQMSGYFAIAALIAGLILFSYTRCIRSTLLVLICSLIAVIWQLGIVHLLGLMLDPYSMLVPFLVFAVGVSHGAQKMNGIMQDVGRGTDRYVAARYTFRRLFLAGLTALIADAVGFGILMIIDIPAIRHLALTASMGVAVLVFTNLVLLPVLLSYLGVSRSAASRSLRSELDQEANKTSIWTLLDRFTERRWAIAALCTAAVLLVAGYVVSLHLQIGDLDPGAPELRQNSRYNLDNAYISGKYGLSSDVFAVIVKTAPDGMSSFATLTEEDRLEQELRQLPMVQTTLSAASLARFATSGITEGNPKWLTLSREPALSMQATFDLKTSNPELTNADGTVGSVIAYLTDHRAKSLQEVVDVAEAFAKAHSDGNRQFLLAAGTSGIEAATNIAVAAANHRMLIFVYAAVIALCMITFRSWRAVVVAVVPLVITSVLCEALMVVLGIGVKVATLPVVALGVGIGVDYALYLLSVQLAQQRAGVPLKLAYRNAVGFTGKVVALVGVTLAAGVVTWAWSPIKFQADMGILLTFMFLWNMIGALVLIPSLSHFLLSDASMQGAAARNAALRSDERPVSEAGASNKRNVSG